MKLFVLIFFILAVSFTHSKVIRALDEEDIFVINDKYPSRYSVLIFVGQEFGFWARVRGFFGETKHAQQERELREIIEFFEKEPHYEIPVIEANVDKADFSNVIEDFGVKSIPWIVILDENNDEVYSKEPIEEADDEILLVMNIFPSTIMAPPSDNDDLVIDIDDEDEDVEIKDAPMTENTGTKEIVKEDSEEMVKEQPKETVMNPPVLLEMPSSDDDNIFGSLESSTAPTTNSASETKITAEPVVEPKLKEAKVQRPARTRPSYSQTRSPRRHWDQGFQSLSIPSR